MIGKPTLKSTSPKSQLPKTFPTTLSECLHFSLIDISALMRIAVGSTAHFSQTANQIRKQLNFAALSFAVENYSEAKTVPSKKAKEFETIRKAADRLLAALSALTGDVRDMPADWVGTRGLQPWNMANIIKAAEAKARRQRGETLSSCPVPAFELPAALKGVFHLKVLADAATERYRAEQVPHRAHAANAPQKAFLLTVASIWKQTFGRTDFSSKAFNAFASRAVTVVEPGATDLAVRKRIERLDKSDLNRLPLGYIESFKHHVRPRIFKVDQ